MFYLVFSMRTKLSLKNDYLVRCCMNQNKFKVPYLVRVEI